jgi:hypothetical protein
VSVRGERTACSLVHCRLMRCQRTQRKAYVQIGSDVRAYSDVRHMCMCVGRGILSRLGPWTSFEGAVSTYVTYSAVPLRCLD